MTHQEFDYSYNHSKAIQKFVKRLEKKGLITAKIKDANYRKVKILTNVEQPTIKRIVFITRKGMEVYVDVDIISLNVNRATYMNETFNELKVAINHVLMKQKETTDELDINA